jgi:hypothetical protein
MLRANVVQLHGGNYKVWFRTLGNYTLLRWLWCIAAPPIAQAGRWCMPMYDGGFRGGRRWPSVFFWALFVAGLLLQALGPHLKIKDNRFILPPSLVSAGTEVRPDAIVARERKRQFLSAVLTAGGAVGLALRHRKALFGGRSSRRGLVSGSNEIRPGC